MYGLVPRTQNILGKTLGGMNFEQIFDDFFNNTMSTVTGSNIKADVIEKENEYLIEAEIPGVNKDDISLELENNILTLSIEESSEKKEEKENYIRKERSYGSYKRSFYIDNIQEDQISAEYKNGLLAIVLPKIKKEEKKSKIEIQ